VSIAFRWTLFGYQVSVFDVDIDLKENPSAESPVFDTAVKRISRRWAKAMTS
jgi:hypothetical protein